MTTIAQYNLDNPPVGLAPISIDTHSIRSLRAEIRSRFAALANLRQGLLLDTTIDEEIEFDKNAPITTNKRMLEYAGVKLVHPDTLDQRARTTDLNIVGNHLNFLIACLEALNVYVTNTNHLSDFELYTTLFCDVLEQELPFLPPSVGVCELIDMNYNRAEADPVIDRDSTLPQPPARIF